MLSKEVQDLVEKSRQQTQFIKSVDAGMDAMRAQNEAMKKKIEEIANQPPKEVPADENAPAAPVGSEPAPTVVYSLSDEDKAALLEVAKGYDDAIEALRDNIPENVPAPEAGNDQSGGNQDASTGGAPQETSSDQSSAAPTDEEKQPEAPMGHQADADAASQAKPLDGTGAPTEEQKQDPAA